MELLNIDSGSKEIKNLIQVLRSTNITGINYEELHNDDNEMKKVLDIYRKMRQVETKELNSKETVIQWSEKVELAVTMVAKTVIELMTRGKQRIEKSAPGDIKKRINSQKKLILGEKTNDENVLKKHYKFLHDLHVQMAQTKEIPSWLQ